MAVNFGDNFNIGAFKPIDSRTVVDLVANLSDGTVTYPYKGMLVSVKNDNGFVRTYRLKTEPLSNAPIPLNNWELLGGSGGASTLDSLHDVFITNALAGDVLTFYNAGTAGYWINRGPIVSAISAGTNSDIIVNFSNGTYASIQVGSLYTENNDYSSENFISDGQNYNLALSTLDSILGAIAPTRAANLTGTSLVLSNTTQFSAKVPSGLSAGWVPVAGSTITNYIVDGTYDLISPNSSTAFNAGQFSNPASYGTVAHVRNGVSFVNRNLSLGVGSASNSDADGSTTLSVTSLALYNSLWAKANVDISYIQNSVDEGTITHALSSTVAGTSNTTTLNFDPINTAPTFSSTPVVTQLTPVTKYLSGVQYYDVGSTFQLSFTAATGIFNRCYHPTAVASINGSAFSTFALNPGATPVYTDTFPIAGQTVTLNTSNISSGAVDGSLTVTLQKPSGLSTNNTQNYPSIDSISGRVNTYGIVSTNTFEAFLDENKRLIQNTGSAFVSNVALSNGEAQVRNGSLTYGNIDYPSKSGDQRYDRRFIVGVQSGGSMTFAGFSPSNIAPYNTGNINIFLQLETSGGYYDMGRPFGSDNGTGDGSSLANSKGGQVSVSGSNLNYSFGLFSTASNSNQFRMIIVFKNASNTITSITIN